MTPDQIKSAVPRASASFLALNGLSWSFKAANAPTGQGKARIRQNSAGLNKTEQAFFDWLKATYPNRTHYSQAITLKLGNGVRYTVDFVSVLQYARGEAFLNAYECKGFARDDAIVKLKVAASMYSWLIFHLVTRKGGTWQIQEVLP